jgi:hypothetical protein
MLMSNGRGPQTRQPIGQLITAAALLSLVGVAAAQQQQPPLSPGEAVLTRFSGTASVPGANNVPLTVIDPGGAVASIIDLRTPSRPPQGQQWFDKPQRNVAFAAQVGQVFGVALDNANPPNIYLTATSAFGLHRMPGNAQWMPGMWGSGGGPGTVYILDARTGYQPRPFADVRLNLRPNTGAALGNIAFDRWNRQFFVSDLETGMIHRIRAADGADLGSFDHGVYGRGNFFDVTTGQQRSIQPIPFDSATQANIANCPSGEFQYAPECWNIAANGRRVWGLGVGRLAAGGEIRLYYSVASSPEFDSAGWQALPDEEKRNSVWSVRIAPGGGFDHTSIRREFIAPDFFVDPQDIARAGYSRPVSDISFPGFSEHPVMLLAERGGIRNFGLDQENSFATPHESRTLRYELYQDGAWRPVGRYDVGSYQRLAEGTPRMLANSAGGIAFGYGYTQDWTIDPQRPDETVWISGDALCSPNGPCDVPGQGQQADPSEVHGIQGVRHSALAELAPASAFAPIGPGAPPPETTASIGLDQSYLVDADIAYDEKGQPVIAEFTRNDATRVGDVAIYEAGPAPPPGIIPVLAPPPVFVHAPGASHAQFASHDTNASHFRYGSHWPAMSHNRWGSHSPPGSWKHWPPGSWVHWPPGSVVHVPPGSVKHVPPGSVHFPPGSKHLPPGSVHFPPGSGHWPPGSVLHLPLGSKHFPPGSIHAPPGSKHFPPGSLLHVPIGSKHFPPGSLIHVPLGSKHLPIGSKHFPPGSVIHVPLGSKHFPPGSKLVDPGHKPAGSGHFPAGSVHFPPGSKLVDPGHKPPGSVHVPPGSKHFPPGSLLVDPKHKPPGSIHQPPGSAHFPPGSKLVDPKHQPPGSVHVPPGSKAHFPPGSKLVDPKHQPPGSVHVPPGSKAHFPPGSKLIDQPKLPKDIVLPKDVQPKDALPKDLGAPKTLPKFDPKVIVQPKDVGPKDAKPKDFGQPKPLVQPKVIDQPKLQPKVIQQPKTTVQPKVIQQPKTIVQPKVIQQPKTIVQPKVIQQPKDTPKVDPKQLEKKKTDRN